MKQKVKACQGSGFMQNMTIKNDQSSDLKAMSEVKWQFSDRNHFN